MNPTQVALNREHDHYKPSFLVFSMSGAAPKATAHVAQLQSTASKRLGTYSPGLSPASYP